MGVQYQNTECYVLVVAPRFCSLLWVGDLAAYEVIKWNKATNSDITVVHLAREIKTWVVTIIIHQASLWSKGSLISSWTSRRVSSPLYWRIIGIYFVMILSTATRDPKSWRNIYPTLDVGHSEQRRGGWTLHVGRRFRTTWSQFTVVFRAAEFTPPARVTLDVSLEELEKAPTFKMPKAEVGSTKYLNNKLKSKGLQRLRWYCQVSTTPSLQSTVC